MSDKIFNEGFLFSGRDLSISNSIVVRHPSIGDILSITNDESSFDIYWSMVNALICDPYVHMVMLDDIGIDYETVDEFDVFVLKWKQAVKEFETNKEKYQKLGFHPLVGILNALLFFLGQHDFRLMKMETAEHKTELVLCDGNMIQKDKICNYIITRNIFNKIVEFISEINCIDKSDQIHPENQSYKKMLIEEKRSELKHMKYDVSKSYGENVGKIIKATCSCGNGGITVFNINDVRIYPLISGFHMFMSKENSDRLLNGQYDVSKLSKKELNWFD